LKFLIDMPLSPTLAAWLIKRGHDAVHASEVGLDRAADIVIIDQARRQGRTVVTADLDYPRLLALAGTAEPSLILFRGGNWSDTGVIAKMEALLQAVDEVGIAESIFVIEAERIRRRRLPIQ
jgi:predicted nuclease of predicted toxin-antitoxin system